MTDLLLGSEHLAFRCNGCGDCCRRLRVALTHHDLRRLVTALGVPPGDLVAWLAPDAVNFAAESASFVTLRDGPRLMVLAHDAGACRLLGPAERCRAYAARPLDCRLYPFVLERDEQRQVTRLSLFDPNGCGDRGAPLETPNSLDRADLDRSSELDDYVALVARWNRLARHRARFGHAARGEADFFDFAGVATSSQ